MFMARVFLLIIIRVQYDTVWPRNMDTLLKKRIEACNNLRCDSSSNISVCGIRHETTTVRFRLFANECALLKYGCSVKDIDAYGLISVEHCTRSNINTNADTPRKKTIQHRLQTTRDYENNKSECEVDCNHLNEDLVCGIRQDGGGYRVKLFKSKCELFKYNCNTTFPFIRTDEFICGHTLKIKNSLSIDERIAGADQTNGNDQFFGNSKSIIVVDGSMLGRTTDANETIENFFAATHVLDLPIREVNEFNTRRRLLKNVGPVKVFQPWITIPKKIETDYHYMPTLSTCYHKCPTQCPDTYSPVCGVPGILAREPSIMFQNHCYMDVAQCKMYWENKSTTAISSSYIESSFLFCLGDQLNGMYRFLPLIKTLQHMGRLKKKSKFRYHLYNMRFFNNYAYKEPKLMG